ncbi:MAG: carbohydrate binding domain-containing protein, partial [Candidatus Marinimicrobia bacterium]|nr:carbohydrate binding domain-containing protein [Candidatus Neomarinimicrobiota bacterium]
MKKPPIFTMFLMIFGLIGLAESADIISNGDFEDWTDNTPDSWTTIDNGITVTSNTSTFYQGSYSASIEVTTGIQGNTDLRQTVSVTNGTQYFVSVWIYHTEENMKARLYVDGFKNYSDDSTTGSWQQLSNTYTASTTGSIEVGLRFYIQTEFDGSEIVYVDGFAMTSGTPNAWINEIHYDNTGADANEGVEVVIQNSYSYDLSDFKITLYGETGSKYGTHTVDGFTEGITSQGFTLYHKM